MMVNHLRDPHRFGRDETARRNPTYGDRQSANHRVAADAVEAGQ